MRLLLESDHGGPGTGRQSKVNRDGAKKSVDSVASQPIIPYATIAGGEVFKMTIAAIEITG